MKKSSKKMAKMSVSKMEKQKDMKGGKVMSPQDKFKAMIAAKKKGATKKGATKKGSAKLSYNAMKAKKK